MRKSKGKITGILPAEKTAITAAATTEEMRKVFKVLFSTDNSLIQFFKKEVIIRLDDIFSLNQKIIDKLRRNNTSTITFRSNAHFEGGKAKAYGDWDTFYTDDWRIPQVTKSLSLTWSFLLKPTSSQKPKIHNINISISPVLKPQDFMQAIFSQNIEDIEKFEFQMMPMTCRIDLQDTVISNEILNLVSEWNQGINGPQYVLPIMHWFKKRSDVISKIIKYSVPIIAGFFLFFYYLKLTRNVQVGIPLSYGQFSETVKWLLASISFLFFATYIGKKIAKYTEKNLSNYGEFLVFDLTNGDKQKQQKLLSKSQASFYKFIFSGFIAIFWNVINSFVMKFLSKILTVLK